MNDKVSLEKVEVLLNSVLKELQKEKMRSRQLEEQVVRLTTEQKGLGDLNGRLLRIEQQHKSSADGLSARLSAVEASAAKSSRHGCLLPHLTGSDCAPTLHCLACPNAGFHGH